jgi:electron transport complex protein RnfE
MLDGIAMGAGFLLVLLALGASRELIGRGSLGADLHLLLGERWAGAGWRVFPEAEGWLFALLPPGAFILLGLMLALGNIRAARRAAARQPAPAADEVAT